MRKYALADAPGFLPTPVDVPEASAIVKADSPTVCFVGRWEARKRPDRFFELARLFPRVRFIAVGGARDADRDRRLRQAYGGLPNLEFTGFVDQFTTDTLFTVLDRSWVLVNTSAREGLPNTFLEACAHRCALLSHADPDQFASRFGRVADDSLDALGEGLEWLLEQQRWRDRGDSGYEWVRRVFAREAAIDAHLEAYAAAREGR